MPIAGILQPEDVVVRTAFVIRGKYDFAVDGGAISTIAITAGTPIANGSVIVGGYVDVITALVGATATIACQVEAANDILTAVAVASWTTGRKNILPAFTSGALTAGTQVKLTADRNISIVIATAALTAGVFNVILYVVPPLA
jgi:hypothetical protein